MLVCFLKTFFLKGALHFDNGSKYDALWVEGVATEVKIKLKFET